MSFPILCDYAGGPYECGEDVTLFRMLIFINLISILENNFYILGPVLLVFFCVQATRLLKYQLYRPTPPLSHGQVYGKQGKSMHLGSKRPLAGKVSDPSGGSVWVLAATRSCSKKRSRKLGTSIRQEHIKQDCGEFSYEIWVDLGLSSLGGLGVDTDDGQ